MIIALVAIAGIASGIAILTVLRRQRPPLDHNSKDCQQCRTGFMCPEALSEEGRAQTT